MHLPKTARTAIDLLNKSGYEAYLVGGCVRDTLLGIVPHDYDLCTSATPEEMQHVFAAFRTVETGLKHGTLTVLMDREPLEITTFRLDGEYLDRRHPKEVTFTRHLENDLSRRDFTVNAMAYHPDKGLVDLFGGREDCKRGVIRCVGNAQTRFEEDALRILRALRFAARFCFAIEEKTAKAIFEKKELLPFISAERIAAELNGLLPAPGAVDILARFGEAVFAAVPALRMDNAQWLKALETLRHAEKEPALLWSALLSPFPPEKAKEVLQGLKMPVRLQEDVYSLLFYRDMDTAENALQTALMHTGDRLIFPLLSLQYALGAAEQKEEEALLKKRLHTLTAAAQTLIDENACYTLSALAVKGGDLSAMGICGPAIGQTLHQLLAAVCKREVPNEKETLLALAAQRKKADAP